MADENNEFQNKTTLSNAEVEMAVKKAHDRNTDSMIGGHMTINPPKVMVESTVDNKEALGVMFMICTPDGENYITFERGYYGGRKLSVAKGMHIDATKYLLNLESALAGSSIIQELSKNAIRRNELFNGAGNILDSHINYIMDKPNTRLDKHVNNVDIHISNEEREQWNNMYVKPEDGIPITDLTDQLKSDIMSSYTHTLDSSLHVSRSDRLTWDSKFEMPMSGINESHLSLSLQNRLKNIFSIYQIIDSETGMIRDDLLPDFEYDSKYVKITDYNEFLESFSYPHFNNNVIHVTAAERTKWNNMYTKSASGIPENDLAFTLRNKIDGAIQYSYLFDSNNLIKSEFLTTSTDMANMVLHMNNTNVHLSNEEKIYLSRLGNPLALETDSMTIVGAINELYELINKSLALKIN